jgi:tetratricopeptide (TPR) repeat protein
MEHDPMAVDAASPEPTLLSLADVLRPAHRHLDAGEIEPAKSLLGEGLQRWPNNGSVRMLAARIAEAEGRTDEAAAVFREAAGVLRTEAEQSPKIPQLALALAQALTKCGDADGAVAALALARERGADPVEALRTERGLAWSRRDWHLLRRTAEELIAIQAHPTAQDFAGLAVACRNLDDLGGAAAAAARALEQDPGNIAASAAAAWAALGQGDQEAAVSHYRRLAGLAPDTPNWAFLVVRMLVIIGRVGEAVRELDAALRRWPNDPTLRAFALTCGFRSPEELGPFVGDPLNVAALRERELRELRERAPSASSLRRPVIADDKTRDVIAAGPPGAEAVVLVFTALNDVMSMPLPVFDRYLASFGVTVVYLKDFQRLLYLRGIGSLGKDYPETIAALRELCGRLRARRLCTFGYSAGGYAAVRYGVELGADRIASFAGETHMVRDAVARLEQGYNVIKKRLQARISDEEMDLRHFLAARRCSGRIELVYPEDSPRDRAHAMHLSVVAGVSLHPVAGCGDHNLLSWLALHADLRAMIGRLLGLAPG